MFMNLIKMSDMEQSYKEKYEQAIERLKQWDREHPCAGYVVSDRDKFIFPELAESEGEKVRKELTKHLKELSDWKEDEVIPIKNPSYYRQWASWLEKQGQVKESTISQHEIETCKDNVNSLTFEDERIRKEIINYFRCQSEEEPTRKEIHNKWIAWLENIPYTIDHEKREGFHLGYKACLEKQEMSYTKKDVVDAFVEGMAFAKHELEKQGEQEKDILEDAILDGNEKGLIAETIRFKNEKQSEQKSDKVKPKFNIGDFIANDYCFGKVIALTDDAYLLDTGQDIPFSCEHNAHLWTIQDAKDGDVLVSQYNKPFIYNGNHDSLHIGSYCGISVVDRFNVATEKCHWTENANIQPATKEQRTELFLKMHEAGYEWDAEKKELKKIEENKGNIGGNSANWSEEDDKVRTTIINEFEQCSEWCCANGLTKEDCIDWLKSLKERVQPKQEWSEEDKYMYDILCGTIENTDINENTKYKLISWLKSLRPQNTYNPYKAVVESIAEMCKHYDKASHSGLRDFYDNVKVKCKEAKEYDSIKEE